VPRSSSDPTLLVLASLADGDKHGYAIMVDVQEFAGVELGPGTLYGAITRLEERGFIKPVQSGDRRQPYRTTAAGRRYLEEELAGLEAIVRTGLRRLRQA
jgi:DNA-binding PadR family transcriptional regulator